jgi:hypothetical protein
MKASGKMRFNGDIKDAAASAIEIKKLLNDADGV